MKGPRGARQPKRPPRKLPGVRTPKIPPRDITPPIDGQITTVGGNGYGGVPIPELQPDIIELNDLGAPADATYFGPQPLDVSGPTVFKWFIGVILGYVVMQLILGKST